MKTVIRILLLLSLVAFLIYSAFIKPKDTVNNDLITEPISADISELYFYGNHFNFEGTLQLDSTTNISKVEFILYNDIEIPYDLMYTIDNNTINFKTNEKINTGLNLDDLGIGQYKGYLKITNDKNKSKYYVITNKTKYLETEYYPITKDNTNKKITISSSESLLFDVINSDDTVYDVVIDPGHGGIDGGACHSGYCETDFTYKISNKLKDELESNGYRVLLTRGNISKDEVFNTYGEKGRVNIANASKAKYLFSIHLNYSSGKPSGLEIYAPYNSDLSFARNMSKSIVETSKTTYSINPLTRVYSGVYVRTFTKYDIEHSKKEALKENRIPYNITTKTTYYYIIRETGGYITGAYADGREKNKINYYYDTNVGREAYLVELGYINSSKDRNNLLNNQDSYVSALKTAILSELKEK